MQQPEKRKVYYCEKCGKAMTGENFYTSNNLEKYPDDGKLSQCKKCITMHVDNWDPKTYLWILQECDVPYVPEEWNKLLLTYAKDPTKAKGSTILGRYLSKMKLTQYRKYRWHDTESLRDVQNHRIQETMERQGYTQSQIDETINKSTLALDPDLLAPPPETQIPLDLRVSQPENDYFAQQAGIDEDEFAADLTEEDKKYLCMKWGRAYKPSEWVALEQLYNDMMESYDIQSAGHIDILKKCCKTSLKADQLLDIGDVEGAQKMVRMYDMLMKAGKFTAAQNKGVSGDAVDSLAELFAMCEMDGFVPRYYTDGPQDKVDRTLQDMQQYVKTLVTEELNLGNLIENAVKQIEIDKAKEAETDADAANDEDLLENEIFAESDKNGMTEEDMNEFNDWQDKQDEEAHELQKKLEAGEL